MRRPLLFAILAILLVAAPRVFAQQSGAPILLAEVTGVIGPPSSHHVENAIERAEERSAEVLILQMNTPGGLETSMRDIIEDILDSQVPVVTYVAPSGGRAASAGTFILYASHVAAMAPGTNVGAATPVQMRVALPPSTQPPTLPGGEEGPEPGGALERKAINDAAAFIRSLAALRGRNAEWAERAVREGEAVSASEALELGVIEIIADDLDDLLQQLDGRTIAMPGGERTLSTQGRLIERVEPTFVTQLLGVIANPNVAFLLMLIGVYGLIYEFASPGAIGPGVLGAVCLVLGLYALNQLPLNYAGLALIVLGIGLMAAEAFTPTFGVLGVGGAIAFLIGAAMLIDTDLPAYRLSWFVILASAALTGGFFMIALAYTLKTHARKTVTGREAMIGSRAKVLDWSGTSGHVWIASERWRAEGPQDVAPGSWVRVTGVDSLRLHVVADEPAKGDRT